MPGGRGAIKLRSALITRRLIEVSHANRAATIKQMANNVLKWFFPPPAPPPLATPRIIPGHETGGEVRGGRGAAAFASDFGAVGKPK